MKPIPEFKFKGRPLDKEETANLSVLLMAPKGLEKPIKDDPEVMNLFPAKIAVKRIELYPLSFWVTNFFFIISVATFIRTPGHVMALLWLAKDYSDKHKKNLLTLEDWCLLFPGGVPTEDEFVVWWDSQKTDHESLASDNLVDYPELWGCPKGPMKDTGV